MKIDYTKVNRIMCEEFLLHLDSQLLMAIATRHQMTTDQIAYLFKKMNDAKKNATTL